MAIDYKALRSTLESGSLSLFSTQYRSEVSKYFNNGSSGKSLTTVLNTVFGDAGKNYTQSYKDNLLKSYLTTAATGLSDISKYVTSDASVKLLTDNLTDYFKKNIKSSYTGSDVNNYINSIVTNNMGRTYATAANQATKNLDITDLGEIYKTKGQDAYRAELAKRLSTTLTEAGLSSNLTGSLFTGDARFDEGASGETLKNLSNSLFQLSKETGTDYAASKLSKIFSDASGSGVFTQDITSYFNPYGTDPTGSIGYLQSTLDKLDKTATTLTNETQAAAKAAAEREAQIAQEKADAQSKADAEVAAIKLGQATALKKTQLLKRNTGGGSEGLSLFRQLATLGPGGGIVDDAQGKTNNLGSTNTYGK